MLDLPVRSELRCFSSKEVPQVWHLFRENIQRALDQGSDYTLADVYSLLTEKRAQLWTYERSAVVTSINHNMREKFCTIIAAGGHDMHKWLKYLPTLEEWAMSEGCETIRIYGRRGWSKLLGYDIDYTRMSKKL